MDHLRSQATTEELDIRCINVMKDLFAGALFLVDGHSLCVQVLARERGVFAAEL